MGQSEKKRRPDPLGAVFCVVVAALVWLEFFPPQLAADETVNSLLLGVITRALGGGLFIALTARLGWRIWGCLRRSFPHSRS